jgi:hypothetical protein
MEQNTCFYFDSQKFVDVSCKFTHRDQQTRFHFNNLKNLCQTPPVVSQKIGINELILSQNFINKTVINNKTYYTSISHYSNYRGQDFIHLSEDLCSTGLASNKKEASLKSWAE